MRASKPKHSPRDEHLKDLFCVRSHCFPQQGAAGCTASLLLADPGDVQEAMVLLRDTHLRIKQIIESCWKAQGYPDTPTQNGRLSSFCPTIPFEIFCGVTLATRILGNLIITCSIYLNSIPLDISRPLHHLDSGNDGHPKVMVLEVT
jgi:hypothetical protein